MTRPLKVFTAGPVLAPGAVARMVGNNHSIGQVDIYLSAPTKAAALAALAAAGLTASARNVRIAAGLTADALAAAELFTEPTILVTHNRGTGTVVQLTAGAEPAVIGEVSIRDRDTTVIGPARYAERSARFTPTES